MRTLDQLEARRERCEDRSVGGYLLDRALGTFPVAQVRQIHRMQYLNIRPSATLYEQEMSACLKRFSLSGKAPSRPPTHHKCA